MEKNEEYFTFNLVGVLLLIKFDVCSENKNVCIFQYNINFKFINHKKL